MSVPAGQNGSMLAAGEVVRFDGPWDRPDELRRLNGLMRYSNGTYNNGFAITGMAYLGHWYATDQIPRRAVDQGLIGRLGNIDPSDGGLAHRYSLSGRWNETDATGATRISAYVVRSDLALFSNFTYFLSNPIDGDQFKQADDRWIAGGSASRTFFGTGPTGLKTETTIGLQTRYDAIRAGLFNTKERTVLSTVRNDQVQESSVGVFGEQTRRIGSEFTLRSKLNRLVSLDFDAAYARARFLEDDPAAPGRYVPGAVEGVVSAAINFDDVWGGWFGGLRVRYFGPRPLIEDNSVRSNSSTPVSARLGYKFDDGLIVRIDAFNIFDQKSHQIDYFYASRMAFETAAVDDIHFHPLEPRSFRLIVRKEF